MANGTCIKLSETGGFFPSTFEFVRVMFDLPFGFSLSLSFFLRQFGEGLSMYLCAFFVLIYPAPEPNEHCL